VLYSELILPQESTLPSHGEHIELKLSGSSIYLTPGFRVLVKNFVKVSYFPKSGSAYSYISIPNIFENDP
jgi:hypothetical protein